MKLHALLSNKLQSLLSSQGRLLLLIRQQPMTEKQDKQALVTFRLLRSFELVGYRDLTALTMNRGPVKPPDVLEERVASIFTVEQLPKQ
jgi:hypothetical protein